jgi:hypothetical protein
LRLANLSALDRWVHAALGAGMVAAAWLFAGGQHRGMEIISIWL